MMGCVARLLRGVENRNKPREDEQEDKSPAMELLDAPWIAKRTLSKCIPCTEHSIPD